MWWGGSAFSIFWLGCVITKGYYFAFFRNVRKFCWVVYLALTLFFRTVAGGSVLCNAAVSYGYCRAAGVLIQVRVPVWLERNYELLLRPAAGWMDVKRIWLSMERVKDLWENSVRSCMRSSNKLLHVCRRTRNAIKRLQVSATTDILNFNRREDVNFCYMFLHKYNHT